MYKNLIVSNPSIMMGKPVVVGIRIKESYIVDYIAEMESEISDDKVFELANIKKQMEINSMNEKEGY